MLEHRVAERTRTFITGRLVFAGAALTVPCEIRNLSATGARIVIDEKIPIPTDFTLEIPSRNRSHHAHIAWRHGDSCGVAFKTELAEEPAGDETSRLHALEAENADLRRQVRALKQELAMRAHLDESSM